MAEHGQMGLRESGVMMAAMKLFESRSALAEALAQDTALALEARLQTEGKAMLAVSGGTTPMLFLEALSRAELAWSRVVVTLVDERWVPEENPRSNAALVRRHLLTAHAASASFVPLYNGTATPAEGIKAQAALLASQPLPLAAVILGMGEDGHTASFFPGGDRLSSALSPPAGQLLETMEAPNAGEPRITLTLPVLLQADFLALHIEGERKREVLARAGEAGTDLEMPVRAVLARKPPIYWCP